LLNIHKEIILLQNAEKLLMKRTGQRGSGRPPIHCDINVEIILSDKDQVILLITYLLLYFLHLYFKIKVTQH